MQNWENVVSSLDSDKEALRELSGLLGNPAEADQTIELGFNIRIQIYPDNLVLR